MAASWAILIADDSKVNRDLLKGIFEKDYEILETDNSQDALQLMASHLDKLASVLIDINLSGLDGFEILDQMKKLGIMDQTPVIVIMVGSSIDIERKCYERGVLDVIPKPFDSNIVKYKVNRSVNLIRRNKELQDKNNAQAALMNKQNDLMNKQNEEIKVKENYFKTNNIRIIDTICGVIEFRNLESRFHLVRIRGFVEILARYCMSMYPEYKLDETKVSMIARASAMHDIGKIAVPDNILLKPGRLTQDEFEVMKSHTTRGCEIIRMMSDVQEKDFYIICYDIVRHHHERYDGTGYPDGLKGEEISIASQLTALADVYDALLSQRVYKAAIAPDKAFSMIMNGECGVY